MLITLSAEHWATICALSETINTSREAINVVWEEAAVANNFIAASARVVDADKGVIDAEPRPSPEYVKQKMILSYADGLRDLEPDVREAALKLSAVTPKLDYAHLLQLVQEGRSAEEATAAEPELDEEAMAGVVMGKLHEGLTPN